MIAVADTKPELRDGALQLRAPHLDDVPARFALGNHYDIQRMFGVAEGAVRDLTLDAAQAWVQNQIDTPYAWAIDLDGRLIGSIRLHSVDFLDKRANMALAILDPDALGQGVGTQAMRLVARHAFDTLGLHRIALRVIDFNTRAIAAYKKVGFVEEGRERESCCIDGKWHDDVMMGLLARDFAQAQVA